MRYDETNIPHYISLLTSVPMPFRNLIPMPLIALLLAAAPSSAQVISLSYGNNHATYQRVNVSFQISHGDTLVLRRVVIATGPDSAAVKEQPCAFSIESTAVLRPVEQLCSEPTELLSPGDSAWTVKKWIVESAPGEYGYRVLGPGVSAETGMSSFQVIAHGVDEAPAAERPLMPVLIRYTGPTEYAIRDLESVISMASSQVIPVFVAAEAASSFRHLFIVNVDLTRRGGYRMSHCWGDYGIPADCASGEGSGWTGPLMTGAMIAQMVREALAEIRR
jgi:hypothetical protein